MEFNETTRSFYRTTKEAFPEEYRNSIEHYKRPSNNNKVVCILLALGIMSYCIGKII